MAKKFFCTRPELASLLIQQGHKAVETVNIYAPSRPAWSFQVNEELKRTVTEYYKSIGKELPAVIKEGGAGNE